MKWKEQGLAREEEVYQAVVSLMLENNLPPLRKEIQEKVGLKSSENIHKYLTRLEIKGRIEIGEGETRAIKVPGIQYVDMRKKEIENESTSN